MTREEQIKQAAQRLAETKRTAEAAAQCEYDFALGAEWADAHPQDRWISVEDEQPEDGKVYLVCHKTGTIYFSRYYPGCPITHWMPVPRPPKEGGEV